MGVLGYRPSLRFVGPAAGGAAAATILAGVLAGPGDIRTLRVLAAVLGVIAGVLAFAPIVFLVRWGRPPKGESYLHTTRLVERGPYGIVRHPQYLAYLLLMLTFILLSQDLLVVVLGGLSSALLYLSAVLEEAECVEKFGADYRAYARRVPRFNLATGVIRRLRRHRERRSSA